MSLAPTSVLAGAREAFRSGSAVVGKWGRRMKDVIRIPHPATLPPPLVKASAWARANPRRALVGAGGSLAMLVALAMFPLPSGDDGPLLVAAVQEGPFEVTIVEGATLHALRSVSYSSSIPGNQAKILFLAPEGVNVASGDVLIRFDSNPFEEDVRRTIALLAQSRAELVKAEQELKLMGLRNKEELAEARDRVRLAELELASVTDGKGKLAEAESATKLAQARRELARAVSNYEDLEPFLEEGFITKLELDKAGQAVDKAREDLKLLDVRHQTYIDYTRPAEIEGARAALHNRKDGLRQLEQAVSYRLSQTQAALSLAESNVSELTAKLELQKENVTNSEVRATVTGMVIYKEVFFGSEKRKVQVGDQVWPNQPIVMVPDLSQMVAETQIRETDIYKVEKNQRVLIFVEAYPQLQLQGDVSFIGALAQQEPGGPSGKYFRVTILVKRVDPRLRPGMSARVELLVEQIDNARYVPLESVFEKGGRRYCFVLRQGKAQVQEVLTGPSNENHIVIEAGLEQGERVLLRDPTDDGSLGNKGTGFLDIVSPMGSLGRIPSPMGASPLLEAIDVGKVYTRPRNDLIALVGVSLRVERGSFLAIMGPSGSGKSTLLNLLGCLDTPTSGRILLDGENVAGLDDRAASRLRSRRIGFLFQSFNLIPQMNVVENIETALLYSDRPRREWRRRALAALERLEILERASHRPAELSGGEAQRVALARALVNEPDILLADEPTGNLDSRTGENVLDLLLELRDQGRTIVLITHDDAVGRRAERVIELNDGSLVGTRTPGSVTS